MSGLIISLTGTYETPHAAKYLVQLCKHFAHKIEVDYTENAGTAYFVFGPASLTAQANNLTVKFDLNAPEAAESAKAVIDSHLKRFAFRENFTQMNWSGA